MMTNGDIDHVKQLLSQVKKNARAIENVVTSGNQNHARFCAELKDDECDHDWSCSNELAMQAQSADYWMPCGALTLEPKDTHRRRLCPLENIIRTEEECKAAARQFEAAWNDQIPSGFARTATTSDLQFRRWTLSDPLWKQHGRYNDHGFQPVFRDGAWHTGGHADGNPAAPMGCSMDPNGNWIYWNPYMIGQSISEWRVGAEFTPMGGLIHAGQIEAGTKHQDQIGICK